MMEKTLILKHISRMLCLLISYSKFTRTALESKLTEVLAVAYAVINKVFRKTGGRGLCCRLRFVTITGQMDK